MPSDIPPRRGARSTPLPEGARAVFAEYERGLTQRGRVERGGPLDAGTVRVYASRVRQYLAWLAAAAADGTVEGDPLTEPGARDLAARAYRVHLEDAVKRRPATVNAHLTAVDDFYRHRGLGPAAARRVALAPAAPRALDEHDQARLLRAAGHAPLRDKAIAFTAYYAGTRIIEISRLDVDDVRLPARGGDLIARYGGNGGFREVPLHPRLRAVLEEWLDERAAWRGADTSRALFLNRRGGRLSSRSTHTVLRAIAEAAGVPLGRDGAFTPRVLRHTVGQAMTRQGIDIVVVADLLGLSLETARRHRPLTEQERRQAIQRLTVDE